MWSVIADTMRVVEVVESHVPVLNTLSPHDNFNRFRFVVKGICDYRQGYRDKLGGSRGEKVRNKL